jgi:zinc transport system ATP-binding protein
MRLLECTDVSMSYDSRPAVKNVSFSADEGDYLCIVGENGSGKSTLVKGLLGLMAPAAGKIEYKGVRQNEIGYLPQQTAVQRDFPASVFEVALSGCLSRKGLKPFFSQKDKLRAKENLSLLGVSDLAGKSYRELSGGQQQRVLLARALCAADRLLLLDEPVTSLDPVASADFYSLIQKLNKENKITVIMVSHDVVSAVKYANKILHMDTGIVYFGSASDYIKTDICRKMMGGEADG